MLIEGVTTSHVSRNILKARLYHRMRGGTWLCFLVGLILFSERSSVGALEGLMSRHMRRRARIVLKEGLTDMIGAPLEGASDLTSYAPPEVGLDIYAGTFVSLIPIVWATYEFTSRIRVQRNCLVCTGSGLAYVTRKGTKLTRPRKCWSCGGFIPWLGWRMFFFSTFFDPGNGGPLQRPSSDYEETNRRIRSEGLKISNEEASDEDSADEGRS